MRSDGRQMMNLGIMGCGNIGRFVMENLSRKEFSRFSLRVISDLPAMEKSIKELAAKYECSCTCDAGRLADFGLDLVLEAAKPDAARKWAPLFLRKGINVLTMSVGAFADLEFLAEARRAAEEGRCRLLLPTGGIAGLDYLKAAQLAGIQEATLIMTKGPKGWGGAPFFDEHPMDLSAITKPTVLFEGSAGEAIKGFPSNVNVAVAVSLATLGPDKTRLRILCDPGATQMKIEVFVRGATGELKLEIWNRPSPDNPRTSYQACASALATLVRFADSVQLGT
jgi:aspartate dehydrogenase